MPEPATTTISVSAIAAAISAATLAALGVDYYSLLYGLVGALLALPHVEAMGRGRAVLFVILSTFAGAVIGNTAVVYLHLDGRPMLFLGCLVGGLSAQALAGAVLKAVPRTVDAAIARIRGGAGK